MDIAIHGENGKSNRHVEVGMPIQMTYSIVFCRRCKDQVEVGHSPSTAADLQFAACQSLH